MTAKKSRLNEIETLLSKEEVWSDPEKSKELRRDKKYLELEIDNYQTLVGLSQEVQAILELAEESGEDEFLGEMEENLSKLEHLLEEQEIQYMLSDEHDENNAIVSINSGAGGTESQDWADMLLRMFLRWAEKRGFETQVTYVLPGEEAGIKNATFTVAGRYAYGYLKAEAGVHRLVRISPFDSNKRRHTSFASVFVTPEIDDSIDIEIEESDLRVDTYRSSGAGGQHVNTTDSAVRITHIPSGIVVACQNERSQHKNRSIALKLLRSKLYELEIQKRRDAADKAESQKKEISFGSQIRSYVLAPYRLVKDHRTNIETSNVDAVLDGELDEFIRQYLLSRRTEA